MPPDATAQKPSLESKALRPWVRRYLTYYLRGERNASPLTVRNYRSDLEDFFRFLREKGLDALTQVDRGTVRGYLAWLHQQGLVRASIVRKLSTARSFYRFLQREQAVGANPLEQVRGPKLERRLPSFLSQAEMRQFLELVDASTPLGLRDKALLELLYASGLRVSEVVSLNLADIHFATGEIRVWGKGSKERVVLMGIPARQALIDYINHGRPQLLQGRQEPAVFVNRFGKRLSQRWVQMIIARHAQRMGLGTKATPHVFRHSFATHLLDGGADLRVVQELLGHSKLSTTQIYTHVTQAQARRVYLAGHPRAKPKEGEKP